MAEVKKPKLNVIIFAVDSMSESNVIRQLPKTLDFIQNSLNGYIMHGHAKVLAYCIKFVKRRKSKHAILAVIRNIFVGW